MNVWQPATLEEVETLLAGGLADSPPAHRGRYYSDVEDGWELEEPNGSGGIHARGTSQFELKHIVHQLFGAPA
jgi:hypothetical protein